MFKCKGCGIVKADSEYYKAKNKRGLTTKCKVCTKAQVALYREANLAKVQEYDRNRPNHKMRVEQTKQRYKDNRKSGDADFLERDRERVRKSRRKHPEKYKANTAVGNAIRDGKLIRPSVCSCCGVECTPQGHHWSYEEVDWLDVVWLCIPCHNAEHTIFS